MDAARGRLDVLVNNAGEQHPQESIDEITPEQLEGTFRTNIFSMFYLSSAALEHLGHASNAASYMTGQVLHPNGGEIING